MSEELLNENVEENKVKKGKKQSLFEKIRKDKYLDAQILKNSRYFNTGPVIPTRVPLLNVALSGQIDGGIPKGIIQIAAPPKHFKTSFMLELMYSYQEYYKNLGEEYFIIFYDSELGSNLGYYEKMGLDTSRIDHRPVSSVEDLKIDSAKLLSSLDEGDNVLVCVDSIGMLRSNKETNDAINEKDTTDMTRAKAIKSFFRIITSESAIKGIPFIVINHTYQDQSPMSKGEIVAGGRGAQYAAHTLWTVSKAQDKEGDELVGFRFTVNAALSRYVKERSTFPIHVRYGEGIERFSGIFDLALEFGIIEEASKGWYWADKDKTRKVRASTLEEDEEFMLSILNDPSFKQRVEEKYRM